MTLQEIQEQINEVIERHRHKFFEAKIQVIGAEFSDRGNIYEMFPYFRIGTMVMDAPMFVLWDKRAQPKLDIKEFVEKMIIEIWEKLKKAIDE